MARPVSPAFGVAQVGLGNDVVFALKSNQEAEELRTALSRQSKAQHSVSGQTIFEFLEENQKTNVLAPLAKNETYPYAAFLNEHLYFGTSKAVMESLLNALEKDDVLAMGS